MAETLQDLDALMLKMRFSVPKRLKPQPTSILCPWTRNFRFLDTFVNTDNEDGVPVRSRSRSNYDIVERGTTADATIDVHELQIDSLDYPVICELGPSCIVKFSHMWHVLARHRDRLLSCYPCDGPCNYFYALGEDGKLMCYNIHFDGERWGIGRRSIDCEVQHSAGSLFFSY
jgi:hypothetical protein